MSQTYRALTKQFRQHLDDQQGWPKWNALLHWLRRQGLGSRYEPFRSLRRGHAASERHCRAFVEYLMRNMQGTAANKDHEILFRFLRDRCGVVRPTTLSAEETLERVTTSARSATICRQQGDPFTKSLHVLRDLFQLRLKPWNLARPCYDEDEVQAAIRWMFIAAGVGTTKRISTGDAIAKAETLIGMSLLDYQKAAIAWWRFQSWTVAIAMAKGGEPVGMSIALAVRETAYDAVRNGHQRTSCRVSDLCTTSPRVIIEGLAARPVKNGVRPSTNSSLSLLMSALCQQAYLSTVPELFVKMPLRLLTFAGTKENARRAKWAGYKATDTRMHGTDIPLLERQLSIRSPRLFHPIDSQIVGSWLRLQMMLRQDQTEGFLGDDSGMGERRSHPD